MYRYRLTCVKYDEVICGGQNLFCLINLPSLSTYFGCEIRDARGFPSHQGGPPSDKFVYKSQLNSYSYIYPIQ